MSFFSHLLDKLLHRKHQSAFQHYQQAEDIRDLNLELVQQEPNSDEETFATRRPRRTSPGELVSRWEALSSREQEVTALICLGYTNGEIASKLGISAMTIKSHIRNVLRKFQMHSKIELSLALEEWDFTNWDRPPYG
jgi:DNA-binding NarL/FixJ family response regulator